MKLSFALERRNLHGTQVFGVEGTDYNLVKKNDEGSYEPVASMDQYVMADDLDENYGIWQDREITKGAWFWKKTVREADGQIQPDEVSDFPEWREYQSTLRLGPQIGIDYMQKLEKANIRMTDFQTGDAVLETDWQEHEGYWGRPTGYKSPLSPLANAKKD